MDLQSKRDGVKLYRTYKKTLYMEVLCIWDYMNLWIWRINMKSM